MARPFSHRLAWGTGENALARSEAKARQSGRRLLDLTVSNPTQVGIEYPSAEIDEAFAGSASAVYQPTPRGLDCARAAVVDDYARRGVALGADALVLTASSSESYALLFKLLGDPGQVVLCPEPSYPLFEYLGRLEGLAPRPYRLTFDGRWRVDFSTLQLQGAAALVLVSPNNPTGSFIGRDDFLRMAELAARNDLALIVDEVFADYAMAPASDAVHAAAGVASPALVFSLGGLSKSCGLPHLKLGWIATSGPDALARDALSRLELVADTYLSVGTPVQKALPALLRAGTTIRRRILERVQRNQQVLRDKVGPTSPCTLLPTEAGWCAILRVPEIMTDEAWACSLLEQDGVMVQPGYFFDLDLGATLVISLITEPKIFDAGIERILARMNAI